jgi:hypothetical protein
VSDCAGLNLAQIVWEGGLLDAADRMLRFTVGAARLWRAAVPLRFSLSFYSPFNPPLSQAAALRTIAPSAASLALTAVRA